MTGAISRVTPLLTDVMQIEPGDQVAVQIGTEFLLAKEAQIQARLAGIEAELAESEGLPALHVLEHQATDALQALLDLIRQDAPIPATHLAPAPVVHEPELPPTNHQRGLKLVLGLVIGAWLITLAVVVWLLSGPQWLPSGPQPPSGEQVQVATAPTLTTVVVVSSTQVVEMEPAIHVDLETTSRPAISPILTPSAPTLPGGEKQATSAAVAVELQIPDTSGTGSLQVPLAIMTETIGLEGGKPVLHTSTPATGAGLHRASASFGQTGPIVIALSLQISPDSLQTVRPGDFLTGCNADEECFIYRVTNAETWEPSRVGQVLAAWPPDLGLLICASLENETTWIVQAQLEDDGQ